MKKKIIYIHGMGGNAAECEHYRPLFKGHEVVGLDYKSATPWEASEEFPALFDEHCGGDDDVILIANSIGAYFSMNSINNKNIRKAYFISPIVDMEMLIAGMMERSGIPEEELRSRGEIVTPAGEQLSWEYLCYVREHPLKWDIPTEVLYGSEDMLTSLKSMQAFAEKFNAVLTVMDGGEHWFHTPEQMAFLDRWIENSL